MPFGHAVNEVNGYPLVDTPNLLPPNGMQKSAMSKFADCHPAKPRVAVRMSVTPELRYGVPYKVDIALRHWEEFPLAGKASQ